MWVLGEQPDGAPDKPSVFSVAETHRKVGSCGAGLWEEAARNLDRGRRFSVQVEFQGTRGTARGITSSLGTTATIQAPHDGCLEGVWYMTQVQAHTRASLAPPLSSL
ncbi:hypothetical protein NDU88_002150 [Pleurodeles waltl]|uniref:Uncharacterized protein n=1 Tax=Pleurodeles waltl TaxID=8319 RepID=A0AAV7LZQ4_PLEWA|nr:hypothetical protein NDU88_002150 [Pleurodeles waltl]